MVADHPNVPAPTHPPKRARFISDEELAKMKLAEEMVGLRDEFAKLIAPSIAGTFADSCLAISSENAEQMPDIFGRFVYAMADGLIAARNKVTQ